MRRPEPDPARYQQQASYEDALWEWQNNALYGWCNKNRKPDGTNYDIYKDGLKIYTTLNSKMQQYAEEALNYHLSTNVQPLFDARIKTLRNPPFSNDMTAEETDELLYRFVRQSERYRVLSGEGKKEKEIREIFNKPIEMNVFEGIAILLIIIAYISLMLYTVFL